jgi:Fic/DOC family
MATPSEKLADSLERLKELQDSGIVAIKADALSRTHKERLLENGFLAEVHKGWYIAVSPEAIKGDSTEWYSNYWGFCAQFLNDRFGQNWCISPERSLLLHGGNTTVPPQMIIRSPESNNYNINLPYNTSLFLMRGNLPPADERTEKDGISMYSLAAALVRSSPNTFVNHPIDVRTVLSLVSDASSILALLLDGGHSVIAGRIAGAFRNNNQERIAENIIKTMQKVGYDVREADPFKTKLVISLSGRVHSPYGNRIKLMWQAMRDKILPHFPTAPGLAADKEAYLQAVEKIYVTDAYHSLSIEKYKVTPELIERVRKGTWNAKGNEEDRKQRDAMAARGYWDAFQVVVHSIGRILDGQNPGTIADQDHGEWFAALFGPSVTAGLLKPSDLAGYRNHQVYIGRSMHTPLNKEAVRDAMPVFFELLVEENEASVRAVLGHFVLVFIHPYMDGNGRMGRFLMNVMLASGGYPWTVIPVERREEYMQTLEKASVGQDIGPFAKFLSYLVDEGMKGTPVAKI